MVRVNGTRVREIMNLPYLFAHAYAVIFRIEWIPGLDGRRHLNVTVRQGGLRFPSIPCAIVPWYINVDGSTIRDEIFRDTQVVFIL